ncbi:gamma carbonic anhydrase family protein [Pseudarthrobacter scleromae]|uniref:gamma carbonic anhydrase family protein n=1 Tax=Pseudarthrobacter scleromae TaxID=158897 RepID=UPI003633BD25
MTDNILAITGHTPSIASDAWVAPTATVVDSATIGPEKGIFYSAFVRPDVDDMSIGAVSKIQDTAIIHADPGHPARIGNGVSVGHCAVLHGCTVDDGALIGMNATVLNGAVIGAGSLVAANALVLEGSEVPPDSLVPGVPAKVRRPLTPEEIQHCRQNAFTYTELTQQHRDAAPVAVSA